MVQKNNTAKTLNTLNSLMVQKNNKQKPLIPLTP